MKQKQQGDQDMKHIRKVTVARANLLDDIVDWFENAWDEVSGFFKDLFGG